jgi:hypothetical protein
VPDAKSSPYVSQGPFLDDLVSHAIIQSQSGCFSFLVAGNKDLRVQRNMIPLLSRDRSTAQILQHLN